MPQITPEQTIVPAFNRLVAFDVPRYHEVTAVTVEDDVLRPIGAYLDGFSTR